VLSWFEMPRKFVGSASKSGAVNSTLLAATKEEKKKEEEEKKKEHALASG